MKTRGFLRSRSRGASAVETVLGTAVILGCFVYPLSQACKSVGQRVADETETCHVATLDQAQ